MPWDLPALELPSHFKEGLDHGQLTDDEPFSILKDLPLVRDMPTEAGYNDHRKDINNKLGCVHRAWETQGYKLMRLIVNLYHALPDGSGKDSKLFMVKLFALSHDLCVQVRDHRNAHSIQHNVEKTNPLFDKKDLALLQFQNNVNKQGKSKG